MALKRTKRMTALRKRLLKAQAHLLLADHLMPPLTITSPMHNAMTFIEVALLAEADAAQGTFRQLSILEEFDLADPHRRD